MPAPVETLLSDAGRFPTEQISPAIRPDINPLLLDIRRSTLSILLFYSEVRRITDRWMNEPMVDFEDLGGSEEVAKELIPALSDILAAVHSENIASGVPFKYGSSYGDPSLRSAVADFFTQKSGVKIDPEKEVMVIGGMPKFFRDIMTALDTEWAIIPSWAPYPIRIAAMRTGKKIIDVPLELETGNYDLSALAVSLDEAGARPGKILFCITNPSSPAGTVMTDEFVTDSLIPFMRKRGIWAAVDSYIHETTFDDSKSLKLFLSYPGARDMAVEYITASKEVGLPDARIGTAVGNRGLVNALRMLASADIEILSVDAQRKVAAAFRQTRHVDAAAIIIDEAKTRVFPKLEEMGWLYLRPKAGINMLLKVPPGFIRKDIEDPSLLFAFSLLRRFNFAICPASVFNLQDGKYYVRLILKKERGKIYWSLGNLQFDKFNWDTDIPTEEDYRFLKQKIEELDLTRL